MPKITKITEPNLKYTNKMAGNSAAMYLPFKTKMNIVKVNDTVQISRIIINPFDQIDGQIKTKIAAFFATF